MPYFYKQYYMTHPPNGGKPSMPRFTVATFDDDDKEQINPAPLQIVSLDSLPERFSYEHLDRMECYLGESEKEKLAAMVDALSELDDFQHYAVVWSVSKNEVCPQERAAGTEKIAMEMDGSNTIYKQNLEIVDGHVQMAKRKYARQKYKVYSNERTGAVTLRANCHIKQDEIVGCYQGHLLKLKHWEAKYQAACDMSRALMACHITGEFLEDVAVAIKGVDPNKRFLKEDGLVLDFFEAGNELRFLQYENWTPLGGRAKANVEQHLMLTRKEPYIKMVLFAKRAIKRGEQLLLDSAKDPVMDRVISSAMARLTLGAHGLCRSGPTKIAKNDSVKGSNVESAKPAARQSESDDNSSHKILYVDTDERVIVSKSLGDDGRSRQISLQGNLPEDEQLYQCLLHVERGDNANDLPSDLADAAEIVDSQHLEHATLESAGRRRIEVNEPDDDPKKFGVAIKSKYRLTGKKMAIINGDKNAIDQSIRLCRIRNDLHPANLFRLPVCSEESFGLFAKQSIKRDTWICPYAGRLTASDDAALEDSAYVFEFDKEELKNDGYQIFGRLFIDSKNEGSLSSCINDCRSPYGMPRREANVFMVTTVHKQKPVCLIMSERDIVEGEELLMDYGPYYWDRATFQQLATLIRFCVQTDIVNENLH